MREGANKGLPLVCKDDILILGISLLTGVLFPVGMTGLPDTAIKLGILLIALILCRVLWCWRARACGGKIGQVRLYTCIASHSDSFWEKADVNEALTLSSRSSGSKSPASDSPNVPASRA